MYRDAWYYDQRQHTLDWLLFNLDTVKYTKHYS